MKESPTRISDPKASPTLVGSPVRVIATAFFLFALAFFGLSAPLYWNQWRLLRTWPRVRATVVQSRVITLKEVQGQPLYDDEYVLRFPVHDNSYVVTLHSNHPSTSYRSKAGPVARLPQGSSELLCYNPADPTDVRMHPGYNIHFFRIPVVLTAIGLGFALVGGILVFLSSGGRDRTKSDPEIRQRIA